MITAIMATIDKYCQKSNVDYSPILNLCADEVQPYIVCREKISEYEFPRVDFFEEPEICLLNHPGESSYSKLKMIPSITILETALQQCSVATKPQQEPSTVTENSVITIEESSSDVFGVSIRDRIFTIDINK